MEKISQVLTCTTQNNIEIFQTMATNISSLLFELPAGIIVGIIMSTSIKYCDERSVLYFHKLFFKSHSAVENENMSNEILPHCEIQALKSLELSSVKAVIVSKGHQKPIGMTFWLHFLIFQGEIKSLQETFWVVKTYWHDPSAANGFSSITW